MLFVADSNNSSSGGIGLAGVVFVVFLILKLAEIGVVATWSWWWVTSPLWIGFGVVLALAAIAFVVGGVASYASRRNRLRRFM